MSAKAERERWFRRKFFGPERLANESDREQAALALEQAVRHCRQMKVRAEAMATRLTLGQRRAE